MGVAITEILKGKKISTIELKNKILAVDAFNVLYQFLTTLRGPDGTPLQNSKGQITSHIQGLLSRNLQFLKDGIKPVYVFDGKAPKLKDKERERRKELKSEAIKQYEIAKERNDLENMRKFSSRMITVDKEIIESSKKLLDLLGIPYVDAPSEGEAQASYMVQNGLADFVVSQDADALIFGSPNLIRNLSITGKRKKTGKLGSNNIDPICYSLEDTLSSNHITEKQLVATAILIGTDFNIGGIKGLGPKKALAKVKSFGEDFESLFKDVNWNDYFDFSYEEIFLIFENSNVEKNINLVFNNIDIEGLKKFLVEDYDFSPDRFLLFEKQIVEINDLKKQKGLGSFF